MNFLFFKNGEVYAHERSIESLVNYPLPFWVHDSGFKYVPPSSATCSLDSIGQLIRAVPTWKIPEKAVTKDLNLSTLAGFMEVVDFANRLVSYIPIPGPQKSPMNLPWLSTLMEPFFVLSPRGNEGVITADAGGGIRLWETSTASLQNSLAAWQRMQGSSPDELRVEYQRAENEIDMNRLLDPKHGMIDPTGAPHMGGNMWAGGSGTKLLN